MRTYRELMKVGSRDMDTPEKVLMALHNAIREVRRQSFQPFTSRFTWGMAIGKLCGTWNSNLLELLFNHGDEYDELVLLYDGFRNEAFFLYAEAVDREYQTSYKSKAVSY